VTNDNEPAVFGSAAELSPTEFRADTPGLRRTTKKTKTNYGRGARQIRLAERSFGVHFARPNGKVVIIPAVRERELPTRRSRPIVMHTRYRPPPFVAVSLGQRRSYYLTVFEKKYAARAFNISRRRLIGRYTTIRPFPLRFWPTSYAQLVSLGMQTKYLRRRRQLRARAYCFR